MSLMKSYIPHLVSDTYNTPSSYFKVITHCARKAPDLLVECNIISVLMEQKRSDFVDFFARTTMTTIDDQNRKMLTHMIKNGLLDYLLSGYDRNSTTKRQLKIGDCLQKLLLYNLDSCISVLSSEEVRNLEKAVRVNGI